MLSTQNSVNTRLNVVQYQWAHTPNMVLPMEFSDSLDLLEGTSDCPPDIGSGNFERYQLEEGLSIQLSRFNLNDPLVINRIGTTDSKLWVLDIHIKGSGHLYIDAKTHNLKKQDSYAVGAYFGHSGIRSKSVLHNGIDSEQIHIVMDREWLAHEFSENLMVMLDEMDSADSFFHFQRLRAEPFTVVRDILESDSNSCYRKSFLKGKTLELLTLFFRQFTHSVSPELCKELSTEEITLLMDLDNYIRDNLNEDLSVARLAMHVGCCESKLQKLFKQKYGKSVHKKIHEIKMMTALELLDSKNLSIAQIGYRLGYSNMSHFSAAFRRMHGFPPSAY